MHIPSDVLWMLLIGVIALIILFNEKARTLIGLLIVIGMAIYIGKRI